MITLTQKILFYTSIIASIFYIIIKKYKCPLIQINYVSKKCKYEHQSYPRPSNIFSNMFKFSSPWIKYSDIHNEENKYIK